MRKHLTDLYIANLRPVAGKQIEVRDLGFRGLSFRVSQAGTRTWYFAYRRAGKWHRVKLGHYPQLTLAEAREAWRAARIALSAGRSPLPPAIKGSDAFLTVAELWLTRDQGGKRTVGEARRILYKYCQPLHGMRVSEISRRDIREVLHGVQAPVMARRVYGRLHRFFRWCQGEDWIALNPMDGLPKPGSETSRDRVLTDEEIVKVWRGTHSIGWPWGAVVQLLLLTGARRSEISELKWGEVTECCGTATIELSPSRTKAAIKHDIPLSKFAAAIMNDLPRFEGTELVFPSRTGNTRLSGWSQMKRRLDAMAGIPDWRLHDLRRTCATGLQRLGVPLEVTEAILGHTSGTRAGIVGIYQRHEYRDEKRQALDRWGEYVRRLVLP